MAPELAALLAVVSVAVVMVLSGALAWAGWHARGVAADAREELAAAKLERARAERDAAKQAAKAGREGAQVVLDGAEDRVAAERLARDDPDAALGLLLESGGADAPAPGGEAEGDEA